MKSSSMKSLTILLLVLIFTPIVSFSAEDVAQESAVSDALQLEETSNDSAPLLQESVKLVKSIDIVGNKSIGVATILSKIKTRVGQEYIENVISDDLKRLYNTGYFSDVKVDKKDFF